MHKKDDQKKDEPQAYPSGTLFHASPKSNVGDILKNGIDPRTGGSTFLERNYSPRVYLSTRIEAAWDFTMSVNAHASVDKKVEYEIIHVDCSKIPQDAIFYVDEFYSDYGIWTSAHIPAQAIMGTSEVNHDWEPDDDYYDGVGADHKAALKPRSKPR